MPISNAYSGTPYDTRKRYPNHYSMLQGSIDHSYDGGTDSHNPWPSTVNQPASTVRVYRNLLGPNVEETAAVTDSGAYKQFADGTYLLHPAFTNLHEVVRGKKITFKLFKKKKTIWIWKRTFHLLNKWEQKQSSHYVYEFVGRG